MSTKQQKETLHHFRKKAEDWEKQSASKPESAVNVTKQRNDFVLKVVVERESTTSVLDIGCGTGKLICELASQGIRSVGVDFSKEMIDICKNNAKVLKNAEFVCQSIFNFKFGKYENS